MLKLLRVSVERVVSAGREGGSRVSEISDSDLKLRHRQMWASGDYPQMVETFLLPLGPRLVRACEIQ